jgi:hypothetical protein
LTDRPLAAAAASSRDFKLSGRRNVIRALDASSVASACTGTVSLT